MDCDGRSDCTCLTCSRCPLPVRQIATCANASFANTAASMTAAPNSDARGAQVPRDQTCGCIPQAGLR
eukprot:892832-Prymnesium_polylepis.1